jgi:hypothetical protein
MDTINGVVTTSITYDDQIGFIFQEVESNTSVVTVQEGQRKFEVEDAGAYQLTFIAANFSLADPPIGFPEGPVSWLTLDPGYTSEEFSVIVQNSGTVENQTGKFLIHSTTQEGIVDPTVVNNPNPPGTML